MRSIESVRSIHHDRRTMRGEFNGEAAWTKYAVVPMRPFSSSVFNAFSVLTGSPIFRSTHNPDGRAALRAEAGRLRYMEERGFLVPKIFEQSDEHLVISDIGTGLDSAIKESADAGTRKNLFCLAAAHMATVHASGEYHGRSVTKDLTVKDGQIGMIDLEHEPLRVMPLQDAQARDTWLVFLSAAKYARDDKTLVPDMLETYVKDAPAPAIDSLRKNTAILRPVETAVCATIGAGKNIVSSIAHMNRSLHRHLTA